MENEDSVWAIVIGVVLVVVATCVTVYKVEELKIQPQQTTKIVNTK